LKTLHAVFQPVISLRTGAILGHDGLVRGLTGLVPEAIESSSAQAHQSRLADGPEIASIRAVLAAFAKHPARGKLFLKVAAAALQDEGFLNRQIQEILEPLSLVPAQIVIEVTENQSRLGMGSIGAVVKKAHGLGFEIAISDAGAGGASLRAWSELEPEFVKIDPHFVHDVHLDPAKFQCVRMVRHLAESMGTKLIGEGVENQNELSLLRDLGIEFAQGPFIAGPERELLGRVSAGILQILGQGTQPPPAERSGTTMASVYIGNLATPTVPVEISARLSEIQARFEQDAELDVIPVVHEGQPMGYVRRDVLAAPRVNGSDRAVPADTEVVEIMDRAPLSVDAHLTLQDVSVLLAQSKREQFASAFLITENGRYRGVATAQRVMRELTRFHLLAMRHANPLTALPGNGPFQEAIQNLVEQRVSFVACSCELDHLDAYNDVHGYARADNLIKYTAILLDAYCDERRDFLAHPGGGEFLMLIRSSDWNERCASIVKQFESGREAFLGPNDIAQRSLITRGRRGEEILHRLPALSIGAVPITPHPQISHHHVTAALAVARREAKKMPEGGIFVERRQLTLGPRG